MIRVRLGFTKARQLSDALAGAADKREIWLEDTKGKKWHSVGFVLLGEDRKVHLKLDQDKIPDVSEFNLDQIRKGDNSYLYFPVPNVHIKWLKIGDGEKVTVMPLDLDFERSLIGRLKDEDGYVRRSAAKRLSEFSRGSKDAVAALGVALKDKDEHVRVAVADALGEFGPAAKEAVPALIVALKDDYPNVCHFAAYALGKIGPAAKEAVPALTEALKDKDEEVREAAAEALGKIGPAAKDAVPALTEALKDEDKYARKAAQAALDKIQAEK